MKKVNIVVVTFNRKELLLRLLKRLVEQSFQPNKIIVIDNASTDGTPEYVSEFVSAHEQLIHYCRLKTNTGGSGGFHTGVKLAYEMGADYIWGMDDDALPDRRALEVLVETAQTRDEKSCFVSYTTPKTDPDTLAQIKETKPELISKRTFLFLGFFLPRVLVEEIGFPREDLFIYFDDIDYSTKAFLAGYQIYQVRDSILEHPDMMQETKRFNILGKKFTIQKMPKWKWYYYMRNGILVFPPSQQENKLFYKYHVKRLIGVLFAYPSCFPAAWKGYWDGKKGVTGKNEAL